MPFGASAALTYTGNPWEASRRDSRVDPLGVACSPSQVTLFLPVRLRRDAQCAHVCADVEKGQVGGEANVWGEDPSRRTGNVRRRILTAPAPDRC